MYISVWNLLNPGLSLYTRFLCCHWRHFVDSKTFRKYTRVILFEFAPNFYVLAREDPRDLSYSKITFIRKLLLSQNWFVGTWRHILSKLLWSKIRVQTTVSKWTLFEHTTIEIGSVWTAFEKVGMLLCSCLPPFTDNNPRLTR